MWGEGGGKRVVDVSSVNHVIVMQVCVCACGKINYFTLALASSTVRSSMIKLFMYISYG